MNLIINCKLNSSLSIGVDIDGHVAKLGIADVLLHRWSGPSIEGCVLDTCAVIGVIIINREPQGECAQVAVGLGSNNGGPRVLVGVDSGAETIGLRGLAGVDDVVDVRLLAVFPAFYKGEIPADTKVLLTE